MSRVLFLWHEARYHGAIRTAQRFTHLSLARHPHRVDGRLDRAAAWAHQSAIRHGRKADQYRRTA